MRRHTERRDAHPCPREGARWCRQGGVLPRLLSLLQSLRSFSHPLQRWQWDLLVLEDELPLQFSPRNPLIQPFTLHHKVGRETQRDVMLLGTRRRLDRRGSAPLV